MREGILLIGLFFFSSQLMPGQTTLVSYGSIWHYSDLAEEPSAQMGATWYENAFDDTGWSQGLAQLGYGDGDEAQEIGDTVLTAYFRREFIVLDPTDFGNLELNLLYDDGAVVYLNGTEVWRVNMPDGPIGYSTLASSGSADNEMASMNIMDMLLTGENLLAVEVHQRSAGSSDISFDFKLVGIPFGVVNVKRGPYLQQLAETEITVKWRTSVPTESVIRFGTDVNQLNTLMANTGQSTDHEIKVIGLEPETIYFYQIENDTSILISAGPDLYFKTAPPIGTKRLIRAWILGDSGTKNNNARSVRDAYYNYIGSNHTDLILMLGDNAYADGEDDEYQLAMFENMYEEKLKNTVSWSCLGNHDGHSAYSATQTGPYYDIFTFPTMGESGGVGSATEAYYSFDYGNIHFISLDSYDSPRSIGGSMYNWCEADLENTSADWIIAFWHHPAYSKGSHDSDTEGALKEMRQNFLPLLESHGVDLVMSGHSHSYERSYYINGHYGLSDSFDGMVHGVGVNGMGDGRLGGDGAYHRTLQQDSGTVYVTAGSSGRTSAGTLDHEAMFFSESELGSCVLEVNGGELQVKFLRETGIIDDYFTITKDLGCVEGALCDDGDICTNGDTINDLCQCQGAAITNVPSMLILNADDAPLGQTFKATQSILAMDAIYTAAQTLTVLISPEVTLSPTFEVTTQSEFQILQDGCN